MTEKSFIARDRVPFCCVVFLFVGGVFWEDFVQQLLHPIFPLRETVKLFCLKLMQHINT